jgi:AAHS family benzoate transporter-like MFS transporter
LLGGTLLALALPHHLNFVAFAISGVTAALAVFHVSRGVGAMTTELKQPDASSVVVSGS